MMLNPTDDSTVNQYDPSGELFNYASSYSLIVCAGSGNAERVFIKFDLSSIGDPSKVLFADLYIYQKESAGDPITVEVRKVDNTWSESEITWNNQPSYGEVIETKQLQDGWNQFDLTDYVKERLEADKILSICLKSVDENRETWLNYSKFASKESSENNPYLRIELSGEPSGYNVTVEAYNLDKKSSISVNFKLDGHQYVTPQTFNGLVNSHTLEVIDESNDGVPFAYWEKDGEKLSTSKSIEISAGGTYKILYGSSTTASIYETYKAITKMTNMMVQIIMIVMIFAMLTFMIRFIG